jgi:hypothetical protein
MVDAGGASAFITKPFTSDKVLSTVESVLQGKADATQ